MDQNLDARVCHSILKMSREKTNVFRHQALRELEDELHTEIFPGTEIMTDVGSHHFVKGAKQQQVLVPQPSDDEHDPLVCTLENLGLEVSLTRLRIGAQNGSSWQ